jgi:uncharacterized protein YndB with AHSA1/START domain
MTTRKHIHEEVFDADPETVFCVAAYAERDSAVVGRLARIVNPKPGGVWVGLWGEEDSPDFITAGRMSVFDPPKRIVFSDFEYLARSGPLPFAANLTSEFTVNPIGPGQTAMQVVQDGFPMDSSADEFYAGCQRGWIDTFAGIRRYLSGPSIGSG